jgi:alpha-amylase
MHKKAQLLSELCRAAGDPALARRAIGRAQCNDSYWHGVFGGLYLRHLRDAVWRNLAEAERILRAGQALEAEHTDMDGDGTPEIWVHSPAFSAVVRPHRGGALTELTDLVTGVNLANVLTRRRESYHRIAPRPSHGTPARDEGGMASIHELEEKMRVDRLPPVDHDVRSILIERVLTKSLDRPTYERAEYTPLHSWSSEPFEAHVVSGKSITITLRAEGPIWFEKVLQLTERGTAEVLYRWDPAQLPAEAWFAPEISVEVDQGVTFDPPPEQVWRHDIVTVSKREDGLEETVQGQSITPLWPCELGAASVLLPARVETPL